MDEFVPCPCGCGFPVLQEADHPGNAPVRSRGKAQSRKQAQADPVTPSGKDLGSDSLSEPSVTHWLRLEDGSLAESHGAIPTHVARDEDVILVTAVTEA